MLNAHKIVSVVRDHYGSMPFGQFVQFLGHSLFKNDRILIYCATLSELTTVHPDVPVPRIVKGEIADLQEGRKQLHPVPWELQCNVYDGVKDFFVFKADGQIGHISWLYYKDDPNRLLRLADSECEIKFCLTFPEYRGNGLYPATLQAVQQYLSLRGFRRCFICVEASNTASIRGIEKAGYTRVGQMRLRKAFGVQITPRLRTQQLRTSQVPSSSDPMVVRQVSHAERDLWDKHVQSFAHAHPLNAFDWGSVRRVDGWMPIHLIAERRGDVSGAIMVLMKKLPLLPYAIFYAPHGPVCDPGDAETLHALHRKILTLAKRQRAIFLRIDPNIHEDDAAEFRRILSDLNYTNLEQRWTFWNAPRDEYRIDLQSSASVDDLHNALDRDTRRCIRKGAKDGLTIETATTEDELKAFYAIFKQFSVTRGFMSRGYEYQKRLWDAYVATGRGRLFLAKYQGNVIGGLVCILFGRKCVAMHMGTPYKYQKLQSSYAYLWESIRWAKENGCEWYSFRGVGTTPTQEAFKRKFNPKVVPLAGYFDCPFKPAIYKCFHWLEFTLLPAAWPLLVRSRKVASGILKRIWPEPTR